MIHAENGLSVRISNHQGSNSIPKKPKFYKITKHKMCLRSSSETQLNECKINSTPPPIDRRKSNFMHPQHLDPFNTADRTHKQTNSGIIIADHGLEKIEQRNGYYQSVTSGLLLGYYFQHSLHRECDCSSRANNFTSYLVPSPIQTQTKH